MSEQSKEAQVKEILQRLRERTSTTKTVEQSYEEYLRDMNRFQKNIILLSKELANAHPKIKRMISPEFVTYCKQLFEEHKRFKKMMGDYFAEYRERRQSVISFFKTLYQHCDNVNAHVELRFLPSKKQIWIPLKDIDSITSALRKDENCYFGVSTRQNGIGTKDGIIEIPALWIDLDFKTARTENLQIFSLKPSIIVRSGGGLHVYWILKRPITKREDIPRVENLLRRLAASLDGDVKATDVSRILRVPGTLNLKYDPPRSVEVKLENPVEYDLSDFDFLPKDIKQQEIGRGTGEGDWVVNTLQNGVDEGERHTRLAQLVGHYLGKRLERKEIIAIVNGIRINPPLEEGIEYFVDSIIKTDMRSHPERYAKPEPLSDVDLTDDEIQDFVTKDFSDTENARRWARLNKNFLWIRDRNEWWRFDGINWSLGDIETEYTMKQAAETTSQLALRHQFADERKRIDVLKQCIYWKDSPGVKRALEMARSERYKASSEFDKDSLLFLCKNGLVDLRTGEFRKPVLTDYLHEISNVEFDPEAKCPRWEQFLGEIFLGNQELIRYIQRWCGYTLTGDTREEQFLILEGPGANGKSTLLEVIAWAMGTWGISLPFATFKDVKWDVPGAHHHANIAQMQGKRFIRSIEVKEKAKLNIERLKSMTGRDKISARLPYARYNLEFYPVGKIWLAVNHLPKIYDTTESCWRRVVRIPFLYTVPKEQRDITLGNVLRAEGSGILNWMIQGCLEWQAQGLGELPAVVKDATMQYQLDSTPVRQFVKDHCEVGKHYSERFATLYEQFIKWWQEQEGQSVGMSKKAFGKELDLMGFHSQPGVDNVKFREGLRLVSQSLD